MKDYFVEINTQEITKLKERIEELEEDVYLLEQKNEKLKWMLSISNTPKFLKKMEKKTE